MFHGQVNIHFGVSESNNEDIFLDFRGKVIKFILVNGEYLENANTAAIFKDHKIIIPHKMLSSGVNE